MSLTVFPCQYLSPRMTGKMFQTRPRLASDKENSSSTAAFRHLPSTVPLAKKKSRLGGRGSAPIAKLSRHSTKSYARYLSRSASIDRVKAKAVKRKKARPAPLQDSAVAPSSFAQPKNQPNSLERIRLPLQLPRPVIQPVRYVNEELAHIPTEYILTRLIPQLPSLLITARLYQPLSSSPPAVIVDGSSVPWVIPGIASGGPKAYDLLQMTKGRQPTISLAVWGSSDQRGSQLYPVNELVYSSQCSNWHTLTHQSRALSVVPSPTRPASASRAEPLSPIMEIRESADESADENARADTSFDSSASGGSSMTAFSSTSSSTHATYSDPPSTVHLPTLSIRLPSPATFMLVHQHLHLPDRTFVPALLDLPRDQCSPAEVIAALSKLDGKALMAIVERIHGVWSNVCALGIARENTWRDMAEAWGSVMGRMAEMMAKHGNKAA